MVRTRVGYAGGSKDNPTYHNLGDHTETLQIDYDPEKIDYARLLERQAGALAGELIVVMRVYFEKPRTSVGWKGFINDPRMDDSFHIEEGMERARGFLRGAGVRVRAARLCAAARGGGVHGSRRALYGAACPGQKSRSRGERGRAPAARRARRVRTSAKS